jgi:D-hexose-6-phosphate mutarotase
MFCVHTYCSVLQCTIPQALAYLSLTTVALVAACVQLTSLVILPTLLNVYMLSKQADGYDSLFVRPDAKLDGSKPISGGLPHCFPQFGPGAIQQVLAQYIHTTSPHTHAHCYIYTHVGRHYMLPILNTKA